MTRATRSTDVVARAYAAVNRRDLDAVLAVLDADVIWANGWMGGFVHGRDGVGDYWRHQWRDLDPTVEPLSIEPDADGRVVVEVDQTVRDHAGNLLGRGRVRHLFTLVDGLITRMEIVAS